MIVLGAALGRLIYFKINQAGIDPSNGAVNRQEDLPNKHNSNILYRIASIPEALSSRTRLVKKCSGAGLEPASSRSRADHSTTELPRTGSLRVVRHFDPLARKITDLAENSREFGIPHAYPVNQFGCRLIRKDSPAGL